MASPPALPRSRPAATAGWRSIRSARSRTSGRGADQELETVFFEDRLRRRGTQEGEIVRHLRLRGRGRRDGIDDGGVGIGREGADDFDAGFDLGVGGIDDAEYG